ncbi:hypothetical protein TRIUR3_32165 [Triticum urartu]|uniref:Uncharacterized protein n=1 Tax=Triticum urartu TaxID=4572 RepID=M7ZS03_TRIUA|nr:hypothetical protein TRIUR3_32165 [Triticum urartu]
MPPQFPNFEKCHFMPFPVAFFEVCSGVFQRLQNLQWHFSKFENCNGIFMNHHNWSGIYLINPFIFGQPVTAAGFGLVVSAGSIASYGLPSAYVVLPSGRVRGIGLARPLLVLFFHVVGELSGDEGGFEKALLKFYLNQGDPCLFVFQKVKCLKRKLSSTRFYNVILAHLHCNLVGIYTVNLGHFQFSLISFFYIFSMKEVKRVKGLKNWGSQADGQFAVVQGVCGPGLVETGLTGESGARIDLYHLTDLVKAGRWDEAIDHLSCFLPCDLALGAHGRVLLHFLRVHKAVHDIVSGAPESRAVSAALRICFTKNFTINHAITKLRTILWSLHSSSGFRDSLDFGRVRDKAASTVVYLAYQTPELREHMKEARGPAEPHNVLPIGFGLASSISSHCEGSSSDSYLEAGKRHQGYPLQYVCTPMVHKGAPVDPFSRSNLGTFRSPARNPGMSSDTDFDLLVLKTKEWAIYLIDLLVLKTKEWAIYLIDQRLEAWPDLSQGHEYPFRCVNKDGFPVARISQTIPVTLVGHAKSFALSSLTKAEVPSFIQVLHPLEGPARNYGIPPVTNAGGLPSQAMSAILAPPYDQFLITTEKDAGALSSKAMSAILASPSKYIKANADALPSETMSPIWASPYENSLVSTMTNAGTHKHLSQEHCYTENVCQDFSPRKNPRMELTTVGQGFNPKRQRTTPVRCSDAETGA